GGRRWRPAHRGRRLGGRVGARRARVRDRTVRRLRLALAALAGLAVLYALAHGALIEVGREVVVLRTQERDGGWLETRVWIVDDAGTPTVHGADSQWMRNLKARPIVEMTRDGVTHRY